MTAAKLIAEARRAHRMSASDESRPTLYGRLADALEHADRIARLHEEATENAARYSAVIEKARTLVDGTEWGDVTWRDNRNATGRLLATVDASTVLRERDRAIAERAWDELYVTQYDGAQYASEATAAGVRDPNNPYRAEVDRG